METKNYTQVLIDGKIYTLGGSEDEAYLQRTASYVNEKNMQLRGIPGFSKQSADYQQVMIQLNIADDYFKALDHSEQMEEERNRMEKESYSLKHELVSTQMKLEAVKRKAGRPAKNNSAQVGPNLWASEKVAADAGESRSQVKRFIALNNLTPALMQMVDAGRLKTTPAVELSYLTPEEQEDFLSYMESEGCTPSLSQAQKLKEASKESVLTLEKIQHIMAAKPPSVKPRDPQLMIPVAKVERYFPKGFTSDQMQQVIVKLLENYARAHQHGSR